MALSSTSKSTPPSDLELAIPPPQNYEPVKPGEATTKDAVVSVDYSKRAQWLRAAVLGANDGLLSTSSLMMGIGAVHKDSTTMVLTGLAGLVAGAGSMATGEFVSVYSQHDIQVAQLDRELNSSAISRVEYLERKKKEVPSPAKAALASGVAFAAGALVPLLGAAFVKEYTVRIGLVVGLASLALFGFGWLSAVLGGAPVVKSSVRVLVGGWFSMAVTFGLTKAIGTAAGIN